jgi:hypothetical protein
MLQIQTGQAPQADPAPAAAAAARAYDQVAAANAALLEIRADGIAKNAMLTTLMAERSQQPAPGVTINNQVQPTPVEVRTQVTNDVQPAPVNVVNQVQPTPVEVRNEITSTAPTVNVVNQVQPAAVSVDLKTTLPARVSETVIERDAAKNITRSTTTERDA